jgi:hypothetical protein
VRKVETDKHEPSKNPQIQEQKITSTHQNEDETHEQKSEICSIKTEHDSYITTDVTTLSVSFGWKQKFSS